MDLHQVLSTNQLHKFGVPAGLSWQSIPRQPAGGVCFGLDPNHAKMGVTPQVFEPLPEGKVQLVSMVNPNLQHTYSDSIAHLLPSVNKTIVEPVTPSHFHHVARPHPQPHPHHSGHCKCILCNGKNFSKEEEFILKYGSLANVSNSPPNNPAAVKENTYPLRVWLEENRDNPYPTKSEKLMLSIVTKMTLTQVSTWFANARRRLKKERKLDVDFAADFLPLPFDPTHQGQFLGGAVCHPRPDVTHPDPRSLTQPQMPVIGNQSFAGLTFNHSHLSQRVSEISKNLTPNTVQPPVKNTDIRTQTKSDLKRKDIQFSSKSETNNVITEAKSSMGAVSSSSESVQKSKAIWSLVDTANSS